jgi:hypothetical protein
MSAIRKLITEATRKGLAPVLKAERYRKDGSNFRKDASPTVVWLVNVQASRWNSSKEGQFAVNLGVYHRDLAKLHDELPYVENPLARHGVIQARLRRRISGTEEDWWPVSEAADPELLSKHLAETWTKDGRAWMEKYSSLAEVRTFLVADKSYFLAALASHALKEEEETRHWLACAIQLSPPNKERIDAWEHHHLRKH